MKTKTLPAVAASLLLAFGSASVVALDQPHGGARDSGSAFSVIDRNGDGVIDREEALAAGIPAAQFEQMDTNGDDTVTESEYRNFMERGNY